MSQADSSISKSFGDDYKSKYEAYLNLVESSDYINLSEALDDLANAVIQAPSPKGLPRDHEEALFSNYLPAILHALLRKRFPDENVCKKTMCLFCCWMAARLPALGQKSAEDARVLESLFKFKSSFYDLVSLSLVNVLVLDLDGALQGRVNIPMLGDCVTHDYAHAKSKFTRFLVNCFCKLGGPEFVHSAIAASEPKAAELLLVKRWMKAVSSMISYVNKERRNELFAPICAAVRHYLLRLKDSELVSAKTSDLRKILTHAKKIYRDFDPPPKSDLVGADLEFITALKLVSVPSVEKRGFAIDLIVQKLKSLKDGKFPPRQERDHFLVKMDSENEGCTLAKSLAEHKFVDSIFAPGSNSETIRKSGPVLELMYCWQCLNGGVVSLWNQAANATGLQTGMLQAIESVIIHLSEKDAKEFYEVFAEFPAEKYTDAAAKILVALLKNEYYRNQRKNLLDHNPTEFILKCAEAEGKMLKPREVLEFAWDLVNKSFNRMSTGALNSVIEGFSSVLQDLYPESLAEYLGRCEGNIAANKAFIPNSKLFIKFCTIGSQKVPASSTIPRFFDHVTVGLIAFKRAAAQNVSAKSNGLRAEIDGDSGSTCSETIFDVGYYGELEERLELISFLLKTRNKQDVSAGYIEMLWKLFIANSCSAKEVDVFFRFMKKLICTSRGVELVTDGVFDSFLLDVLLRLSEKDYSDTALDCLINIIIPLNAKYGHIKILKEDKVELADTKIIGIGGLWKVAFEANSAEVRQKAAGWLGNLYTHFAAELTGPERMGLAEEFVANCVENLRVAEEVLRISDPENEEATSRAVLALEMLEKYMKSREEDSAHEPPPPPKDFYISVKDFFSTTQIKVNETTLTSEALQMGLIALKSMKQLESARFVSDGREIMPIAEPLSVYGIFGPTIIEVKDDYQMNMMNTSSNAAPSTELPKSDEIFTATLEQLKGMFSDQPGRLVELALRRVNGNIERAVELITSPADRQALLLELGISEEPAKVSPPSKGSKLDLLCGGYRYFGVLHGLMGLKNSPIVAEKAWTVLSALGVNEELKRKMLAARTGDEWDMIFKVVSYYQLAYLLLALELILKSQSDARWLNNWISFGGVDRLCDIASNFPVKKASEGYTSAGVVSGRWEIAVKCVESALKLVRELVETATSMANPGLYSEYTKRKKSSGPLFPLQKAADMMMFTKTLHAPALLASISHTMVKLLPIETSAAAALLEGLRLIHLLIYFDPRCEPKIFASESAYPELVAGILFVCQNESVKNQLVLEVQTLLKLAKDPAVSSECLDLFLAFLRRPAEESPGMSAHYFAIFESLIDDDIGRISNPKSHQKAAVLAKSLLKLITTRDSLPSTPALGGLLQILNKLIHSSGAQDIISLIPDKPALNALARFLQNEIFGTTMGRSCSLQEIVDYAIPMLSVLIKLDPGAMLNKIDLQQSLANFNTQQAKVAPTFSSAPGKGKINASRATNGYVGLENFGCTCYINSLFQQLYMMPGLRENILGLDVAALTKAVKGDRVTLNLRRIFEELQTSEKQFYAPKEFCENFRFRHDKVIDTHIQEDVDEFFTHLTSKLEDELKLAQQPQVANEELGMVLQNKVSSLEKELHYVSVTENPLLELPLNIKGCKSIQESLDAFFREEILDGDNKYYCDEYKRKIKVSKRITIKSLPNTVVISLKRFECNLTKLNDYCEFPERLNFFKWSCEGRGELSDSFSSSKYDYHLVGVLIHSGTAQTGHYFSYIKERSPASPNYGYWFEFNDTMVKPFEYSQIVAQAFGKSCTSAYLLFYEKLASGSAIASQRPKAMSQVPADDTYTSAKIYVSPEYHGLVATCLALCPPSVTTVQEVDTVSLCPRHILSLCKSVLEFIRETAGKASAPKAPCKGFLAALKPHVSANFEVARLALDFFNESQNTLYALLMETALEDVREAAGELVSSAWVAVAGFDRKAARGFCKGMVTRGMLVEARKNWERFDQFFACLKRFCVADAENARDLIFDNEMIYEVINFVNNTSYPLKSSGFNHYQDRMSTFTKDPNFSVAISLLSAMIRSCATEVSKKTGEFPPTSLYPSPVIELPQDQVRYLFNSDVHYLDWLKYNPEDMVAINLHLCWKDDDRLKWVIENLFCEILDRSMLSSTDNLFKLLNALAGVDAKTVFVRFIEARTNYCRTFFNYVQNQSYTTQSSIAIVKWMCELAGKNAEVARIIKERKRDFKCLIEFLDHEIRFTMVSEVESLKKTRAVLNKIMGEEDGEREEGQKKDGEEEEEHKNSPSKAASSLEPPAFSSQPIATNPEISEKPKKAAGIFEPAAATEAKKQEDMEDLGNYTDI